MVKVVRLSLFSEQTDKDGNPVDYKEINRILWDIQRQTREIKNKTVQYCWEYSNFSSEYYKEHQVYPNRAEILQYKRMDGYVNHQMKGKYDLYTSNLSTTILDVCNAFKASASDFLRGSKSILHYKTDQPIDLHKDSISLFMNGDAYYFGLKLLNREAIKANNFTTSEIVFKVWLRDNSSKTILGRCLEGTYGISASKLLYDRKKKLWVLNLCYSFDAKTVPGLDKDKILGIDLGIHYPVCASVYGELRRFTIDGGEIEEQRRRIEAKKLSLLKQGKNCGEGRIGHGVHARNKPVYQIEDRIARFRDTVNHKYSRDVVQYAVRNNCGVIQMEDLTGITEDADRFLKNWTYYDLQMKIEYKAKEAGIEVRKVQPKYTSQRCSRCGYIDSANRMTQARFCCLKCGFEENADYNASQNISIKDIDKLIEKEYDGGAKDE